jgi:glycine C-acetyltransferase
MQNAKRFRDGVVKAGFTVKEGSTPIVPVMLGDARLASELAKGLLDEGIYVIGFSFPVVPKGEARIRVQLSAQHTEAQVDRAVDAFATVGKRLGVLKS